MYNTQNITNDALFQTIKKNEAPLCCDEP